MCCPLSLSFSGQMNGNPVYWCNWQVVTQIEISFFWVNLYEIHLQSRTRFSEPLMLGSTLDNHCVASKVVHGTQLIYAASCPNAEQD